MVFHISNYMRETNVWMIRKCRWIFWSLVWCVPFYRHFYWDYLGKRAAWRNHFFGGTQEEQIEWAESKRGDWGYHPRYEPKYEFSIKAAKHAQ